jgi:hypothetical protein
MDHGNESRCKSQRQEHVKEVTVMTVTIDSDSICNHYSLLDELNTLARNQ